MEQARSLGKVLIYEIDDLIFDPLYPPEYESYGGNISAGEYGGLLAGMPLFREAAKLCDYAIASTLPLLKRLEPLVQTGRGFLHRNGLDSHNVFGEPIGKDYINIFYGSGTLAHNSDFIDLVLPALERLLREKKDLRLTIVGHLTLPERFIRKFPGQVVQVEKTRTVEEYWQYLRQADINLAVLHSDPINDTKSELKWFEAACFKVPSIVSNTQNYLDVIREGEDALIAEDEEEWYASLRRLVDDASLRRKIGERAYHRVIREYSLEALSKNIDKILKSILSDREKRFENAS
jgi:glycosyltransferase involved in cell wall biosynthesis